MNVLPTKQVSILSLQQIEPSETIQQQLNELFGDLVKDNLDKSRAYDRMSCIDTIYRSWTKTRASKAAEISFYDAINEGLGSIYNVTMLLQDFSYVIKNEEILIEAEKKLSDHKHDGDGNVCSAISCISINRNYRERNVVGRGGTDQLNQLYGVNYNDTANTDDRESVMNEVNIGEIMDTIHIELFHTIRITPNEITEKEEELRIEQDKSGSVDVDEGLYDRYSHAVASIIKRKSQNASESNC